jgi:hypothetical protein
MPKRFALSALTGLVGLALGAGIGVAAAQAGTDSPPRAEATATMPDGTQMDAMHDAMREHMPGALAEHCDEMHGSMGGVIEPGQMNSMMSGFTGDQHRSHHR